MKHFLFLLILGSAMTLASCFFRDEKPAVTPAAGALVASPTPKVMGEKADNKIAKGNADSVKDKSLIAITRYFEKADAIHREAWWVMSSERRPVGKSPFGKIHRALLSSQNIKLSNKSMFRCDRYIVKRDVMKLDGFPQKAEIFEKCSAKIEAKKIAQFYVPNANEIQVVFYPENLEEILGLGATVINKAINCTLRGNDREQLVSLKCQDWAQERSKEHMIRLDVYDYEMTGRNLIKLRGKVYENLSEARKIVADVPMEGKIFVTETEMYPPELPPEQPVKPVKPAVIVPAPVPAGMAVSPAAVTPLPAGTTQDGMLIPPPREQQPVVDPDVLVQQQQQMSPTQQIQPLPQAPPQHPEQVEQSEQTEQNQSPVQPESQQQVPLQQWNPNEDINQQPEAVEPDGVPSQIVPIPQETPQPENMNQENPPPANPIPAGGVYGR